MMMMVCGVCLKYEYEGIEREREERERKKYILGLCLFVG